MKSPQITRAGFAALVLSVAWAASGCGGESAPLPGAKSGQDEGGGGLSQEAAIGAPPGAPGGPAAAVETPGGIETGVPIPLKLTGIGSKAELDHALAGIEDAPTRALFEQGFRQCFSNDRSLRKFAEAVPAMESVIASMPNFAPAYRVLAYAHFNLSFDMPKATELYTKAVELDPNYGEAHYALAFMLTQSDMARARTHFDKAMALGVPDERDLKTQFFQ